MLNDDETLASKLDGLNKPIQIDDAYQNDQAENTSKQIYPSQALMTGSQSNEDEDF